jgi:CRISPR type IV-associated protein Csf2
MHEVKRYEFLLEATQPIAHHEGVLGNHALSMRRKVRQPNGAFVDVPVITADTMRHGLREASAYAVLDAAGLIDGERLTAGALRLLFNGGMMSGRGDAGTVNLDEYRELVELIPPLGIFGGCASNRVIPGKVHVDDALLVCAETAHWWPEWQRLATEGQEIAGSRAHIEEVQRVRMDPMLDPGKRKLLTADAQVEATKQLAASEEAHGKNDAIERDQTKSTMMPRTFERVVQGSLFSWSLSATLHSDLDRDTLMTALGVFLSRCVVGGKKGTGHGHLRCIAPRDNSVRRPSEQTDMLDTDALGGKVGELFRSHVRERADRIREFMTRVAA